jgi:hypothetical protein
MTKLVSIKKIEYKEHKRNDRIVRAIFQEWIGGCRQKAEMPAKQDKAADIPAHDKHSDRHAYYGRTDSIYISQVLRRQVKRIRSKRLHESTADGAEQDQPENQEHLVFPEMQKQKLYGE